MMLVRVIIPKVIMSVMLIMIRNVNRLDDSSDYNGCGFGSA